MNKKYDKLDVQETLRYFGKNVLYSFLIGSAVLTLAKNYKKALLNEELFIMYKHFRSQES